MLPKSPAQMHGYSRNQLIAAYFKEGYSYKSILRFLGDVHGCRILKLLGLRRPHVTLPYISSTILSVQTDSWTIVCMQQELRGSATLLKPMSQAAT